MNNKHNESATCCADPNSPFEVVDRKVTVFTRVADWAIRQKIRRQVKQSDKKDPYLFLHKAEQKEQTKLIAPKQEDPAAVAEKPMFVRELVKAHLESGKSITVLECLRMFNSTELRHVIAELRKSMTILDKYETSDNGKRYKRYYC